MNVEHKKSELMDDTFQSKPGHNNYQIFPFSIKHYGKTNHRLIYEFNVEQTEPGINHKMHCFVFSEQKLANWYLNNLTFSSSNIPLHNLQNMGYSVESVQDSHEFQIKDDVKLYFVFVNWYLLTITKNIHLKIFEEWDIQNDIGDLELFTTVPPYDKSLLKQSEKMIKTASENLKIITPYIDMSLISLLLEKFDSGTHIRIITRSGKDFSGKSSKEAFDHLKRKLGINHKDNSLIHSRIIIKDDSEILVSSSDLTQDSLLSQFNAGIVSKDMNVIKKLIDYFESVWNYKK